MDIHNQEAIVKKVVGLLLVCFVLVSAGFGDEVRIKEKYIKTMEDLKYFQDALLEYLIDHDNAPKAKSLAELIRQDVGNGLSFTVFYLEQIPDDQVTLQDAWGNDFLYKYKGKTFRLASPGSDGKFEGFDQNGIYTDTDDDLEGKDIIISNNGFLLLPLDEEQRRSLRSFLENTFIALIRAY